MRASFLRKTVFVAASFLKYIDVLLRLSFELIYGEVKHLLHYVETIRSNERSRLCKNFLPQNRDDKNQIVLMRLAVPAEHLEEVIILGERSGHPRVLCLQFPIERFKRLCAFALITFKYDLRIIAWRIFHNA
jgi:hypothetical protein